MNDDRRVAGGLIALVAIVLGWILTGAMSPAPPGPGTGVVSHQVTGGEGSALYLQSCAACHGPGGVGSSEGPPLIGVGAASADFMLRTGRMPLAAPGAPLVAKDPAFDDAQIQALVDYVAGLGGGPAIPDVQVTGADPAQGRDLFTTSCAACHGAGRRWRLRRWRVRRSATARPGSGASSVRPSGRAPGRCRCSVPARSATTELDDIAAYLAYLHDDAAPGGATLGGSGPVVEGYVAWFVGMGLLVLAARQIERRKRR